MSVTNACAPIGSAPGVDREMPATQTLLVGNLNCPAMTRILAFIVEQNSNGVMLVDFGKHGISGNLILRFKAP